MHLGLLLALAALAVTTHAAQHMKMVYGWHGVEYTFPDDATREAMIDDGRYIVGNSVPIAMEVDIDTDRVFISMPRFRPGNAATLATVSNRKAHNGEHLLTPYPDWRWHRQGDCEGITSVFRAFIDECRRIWVLDTGTVGGSVDVSVGVNRVCPAKILIFDLDTNRLLKRYEFPENIIKPESVLTTIVVDVRDTAHKCRNSWAYVADVSGFGILVYDHEKDDSWRVQSNEMYPMPQFGFFDIAGSQFDLMDGTLALALTPKEPGRDRTLYFHSLSGDRENWVASSLMRNKTNFEGGQNRVIRQFYTSPGKREGQAASEAFDENGVLFFSVLPRLSVNCWNSAKEYNKENVVQVDHDPEMMQFASGVKVKKNKKGVSEVWMLTSRFQQHMLGGVDPHVMNYRLMKAPVDDLVRGTNCEVHRKPGGGGGTGGGAGSGGRPGGGIGGGGRPGGGSNVVRPGGANGGGGSYAGSRPGGGGGGSQIVYPEDSQPKPRPGARAPQGGSGGAY